MPVRRIEARQNRLVSGVPERSVRTIFGRIPFGGITMAKLIYIANTSLDGYCEDRDGGIDFGAPDEEYFRFINDLERPVGTYLYGRRMYEAMVYWETAPIPDQPSWVVDFTKIWRGADKIVFSKTLASVSSARTTLDREFNVEAIRQMKADTTHDLTVGGADLAAQAFAAGLVDECHLFFWPRVLGGGKPALPRHRRLDLRLLNERRSRSGVVHLHYRIATE
jgi:dihydrofolate reductase